MQIKLRNNKTMHTYHLHCMYGWGVFVVEQESVGEMGGEPRVQLVCKKRSRVRVICMYKVFSIHKTIPDHLHRIFFSTHFHNRLSEKTQFKLTALYDMTRGISAARFAQAVERHLFPRATAPLPPVVCVAVSGGVDSMALARLAVDYFVPRGTAVVGLTVDHRLRPESAAEARRVGELVRALGAAQHAVLTLDWGAKGGVRMNLARFELEARNKRLAALDAACRARGARHLLLAHTLDDQLETMLLRLTTGSSIRGLAGMATRSSYWVLPPPGETADSHQPVVLARPLLDFYKRELYATCVAQGVAWFEDPTNADPGLTLRNAIRVFLAHAEAAPGDVPAALHPVRLEAALRGFQERRRETEDAAAAAYARVAARSTVCAGLVSRARGVEAWLAQREDGDGSAARYTDEARGIVYVRGLAGLVAGAGGAGRVSVLAGVVARVVGRVLPEEEVAPNGYAYGKLYRAAEKMLTAEEEEAARQRSLAGAECARRLAKKAKRRGTPFAEVLDKFTLAQLEWTLWAVCPAQGGGCELVWEIKRQAEYSTRRNDEETNGRLAVPKAASGQWSAWRLFDKRYWVRARGVGEQGPMVEVGYVGLKDRDVGRWRELVAAQYTGRGRSVAGASQERAEGVKDKEGGFVGGGADVAGVVSAGDVRIQPCVYVDGRAAGFPALSPGGVLRVADAVVECRLKPEPEFLGELRVSQADRGPRARDPRAGP